MTLCWVGLFHFLIHAQHESSTRQLTIHIRFHLARTCARNANLFVFSSYVWVTYTDTREASGRLGQMAACTGTAVADNTEFTRGLDDPESHHGELAPKLHEGSKRSCEDRIMGKNLHAH